MSTGALNDDPFPREQATELVKRLPAYAKLALAVGRDERLPRSQRLALVGAGTYVVSPIGLVPGFLPLVGQLDDLYVLLRALRFALAGLPAHVRQSHLDEAGVSDADLERDFGAVAQMGGWAARRGRDAAGRAATKGAELGRGLWERASRIREDLERRMDERSSTADG